MCRVETDSLDKERRMKTMQLKLGNKVVVTITRNRQDRVENYQRFKRVTMRGQFGTMRLLWLWPMFVLVSQLHRNPR